MSNTAYHVQQFLQRSQLGDDPGRDTYLSSVAGRDPGPAVQQDEGEANSPLSEISAETTGTEASAETSLSRFNTLRLLRRSQLGKGSGREPEAGFQQAGGTLPRPRPGDRLAWRKRATFAEIAEAATAPAHFR